MCAGVRGGEMIARGHAAASSSAGQRLEGGGCRVVRCLAGLGWDLLCLLSRRPGRCAVDKDKEVSLLPFGP